MASVLSGTAVVYSMDGRTVAFTGLATTENEPTSMSFDESFDVDEIRGSDGRVISEGATSKMHTLDVEVTVKAVAGTPTRAAADAIITALPAKLGTITLGGFNNSLIDGDWNYKGLGFGESSRSERRLRLRCSRREGSGGTVAKFSTVAAS